MKAWSKPPGYFRRRPHFYHLSDWLHHEPGIARLNHGSFGAMPEPVLRAEEKHRKAWRANPDGLYFGTGAKSLDAQIAAAADAAAGAISAPAGSVALVENATVATAIIARRWADKLLASSKPAGVLLLDACYGAVSNALEAICTPAGGHVHYCPVPFPGTTHEAVLQSLDATLASTKPRFALLDQITSQPALVLPIFEMVELCKKHGVEEVAIDAAHAVGQLPPSEVDVVRMGADFYYSNLHKWAYAPSPVSCLYAKEGLMESTPHVIPSWHAGSGLVKESRWSGTRDYAPFVAVPAALEYLKTWRSIDGLSAIEYNKEGWKSAAKMLSEAWGVELPSSSECSAALGMVRLPPSLDLSNDQPGRPSTGPGVRSTLRDEYSIEAAVGGFGDKGGFLRLSHAVYNNDEEFERLRDAVSELSSK